MPQPTRERLLLKDGHVGFAETQLQIVIKAAALVEPGRVAAYLRLREMAATGRPEEHSLLEARFGEFYGMDGHSPRLGPYWPCYRPSPGRSPLLPTSRS